MHIVESSPAAAVEVNRADLKKSVLWIYFVIFFGVLNESVFNVSTPSIAEQFGLTPAGVSWVVTIFFIVFGIGMAIFGKLSDMFSIRKLIVIGLLVYSFGSLLGFVCQSWYPLVIVARVFQGIGGSSIPALVFVMVARFFTQEERGKMFGIITSVASCAVGIGPVFGGFVTHSLHWSYLFLIPLLVLIAIPSFLKFLPRDQPGKGKLDMIGAVLLGAMVTLLVLFTTATNWLYLALAAVTLVLFIVRIRTAKEPFADPALFANPRYRNALIIGFLIFGTVMSVMFVIPIMMNKVYGLDPQQIGIIMFPGAISAVIFGRVAGSLTVKRGSHFVVYLGLGLIALSLMMQSSAIGMWVWYIGVALVLMYIGFSLLQTALTESVTQILPPPQIGVGMGFFNMTSTISGAVVTALVAKALDREMFAFPFHPLVKIARGYMYGNMILFLSVVVVASALLYLVSFGRRAPRPAREAA